MRPGRDRHGFSPQEAVVLAQLAAARTYYTAAHDTALQLLLPAADDHPDDQEETDR